MSSITQFLGSDIPPTSLINYFSTNGWTPRATVASAGSAAYGAKTILSGALTATVLKELVGITGGGVLKFCSIFSGDTTSRTLRLKIILDSTTIFDSTSAATTSTGAGGIAVGGLSSTSPYTVVLESLRFAKSLSINVASSLSETDLVSINVNYHLTS